MVYCRNYWLHIAESLSQFCYEFLWEEDDAPLGTAPQLRGGAVVFCSQYVCWVDARYQTAPFR